MQTPERVPLSHQTADTLEHEIRNGRYQNQLPGYRTLCDLLGVSPRTIHIALDLLTRRKIILPADGKRARKINPTIRTDRTDEHRGLKSILILAAMPLQSQPLATRSILERIIMHFSRKGWTVDYESSHEYSKGTPGNHLEQLKTDYKNDRWLLVSPLSTVIDWCHQQQLRTICLGGQITGKKLTGIAVSLSIMLETSIEILATHGHRRICALVTPLCNKSRGIIMEGLEHSLTSRGIDFLPSYNMPPIQKHNTKELWKCLTTLFSVSPPSAIITTEAIHLITIYSFCLKHQIHIPRDLSIIVTQESEHLPWLHPQPAYFEFPVNQYVSKISRWLENYPTTSCSPVLLTPKFIPGKSIE